MNPITYRITLDLAKNGVQHVLSGFKVGDTNRRLEIRLTNDGVPYEIERGTVAQIRATLPNGSQFASACEVSDNTIAYAVENDLVSVGGEIKADIQLGNAIGEMFSTSEILLLVYPSEIEGDTSLEDNFKTVLQAVAKAEAAADRANSEAANANSEASKANTAAEEAEAATSSANSAAQYATEQGNYAKGKADAANTAATNANSANEAAILAANNANSAASNANSEASKANTATERANTEADNAKKAADLANTAAANANSEASKANTATERANTATENANTATTAANQATDNANEAAALANEAINNANTAADNANTAADNAEEQATRASEAAEEAETAATSANSAAQYATEQGNYAKGKADAANTAASSAKVATNNANSSATAANTAASEANKARDNANTAADNANSVAEATEAIKDEVETKLANGEFNGASADDLSLLANALKGSASGNPIRLDDVSPLEHEIKVNVNVNGAEVKKYGKNLFDSSVLLQASGWVYENGYYCGKPSNLHNKYSKSSGNSLFDDFLPNTQYTFSFKGFAEPSNPNGTVGFLFYYSDGTTTAVKIKADTEQTLSVTSNAGKTIVALHATYNFDYPTYLKDIQLEVGTTATEYEPYKELTTYTADENGVVNGVTSLYPTTTLIAEDGVIITAEYNKDINKAFEEINQKLTALSAVLINNV